jgi:DnaK suppressor protein
MLRKPASLAMDAGEHEKAHHEEEWRPRMARKQNNTQDRSRYEVLSHMLMDRQAEIQNKRRSLREALPAELAQVKDVEEQSMEDFVMGMDFALMEMESATLRKIDEAILRLQEGRYGACVECDEAISEARLKALPFADLCRACQERLEDSRAISAARGSRFFEEGPPPAPAERMRRSPAEKKATPSRPLAEAESGSIRVAHKPAKVSRIRA